jgi:hypothetical protein
MSGLDQIQIGFENLLKNGFEKLRKGILPAQAASPTAAQLSGLLRRPSLSLSLPRARVWLLWAELRHGLLAQLRAPSFFPA